MNVGRQVVSLSCSDRSRRAIYALQCVAELSSAYEKLNTGKPTTININKLESSGKSRPKNAQLQYNLLHVRLCMTSHVINRWWQHHNTP